MEAATQTERGIAKQELLSVKEKEKSHKHRGIFHLHHPSKDEKHEEKHEDEKKEGSKKEKIAAAMIGLGASALVKVMHPRNHRGGGQEEEGGGAEAEVEEEEAEEAEEEEEEGGKFSAFITMITEAFEG